MDVSQIMIEHLARGRRIALLESDLNYLDKLSHIRVTNYSDDKGGKGVGLEDKYWKTIENKQMKERELLYERMQYDKVEKTLELLADTHPHGRNAIELHYLRNKKMPFVASEIGFSVGHAWKVLHEAEQEFKKIYKMVG